MGSRRNLHDELKALLGTNNCYFQPPESIRMSYPCYRYKREPPENFRADNIKYAGVHKYGLWYITYDPDDPLIEETEDHFAMCKLVRVYTADNLNHNYYELYY